MRKLNFEISFLVITLARYGTMDFAVAKSNFRLRKKNPSASAYAKKANSRWSAARKRCRKPECVRRAALSELLLGRGRN
jgi:hypothetical protein